MVLKSSETMSHSKRLEFNSDDDLCLLREVVGQNPLQNPEKWNIVQANIRSVTGKEFIIRTLKDHLMLLLTLFKKKSDGDKFKSGTEEVYTEKDTLLQEILDICKEFDLMPAIAKKNKVFSKERQIAALGRQTREDDAVNAMNENNNDYNTPVENIIITEEHDFCDPTSTSISVAEIDFVEEIQVHNQNIASSAEIIDISEERQNGPKPKKLKGPGPVKNTRHNKSVVLRKNAMEYLTQKNAKDQEIRLKELQLQEEKSKLEARKIKIEEKRLEMELEDRKKRNELEYEKLKLDVKQRTDLQAQVSSQQK